jgi:hypothetical protein
MTKFEKIYINQDHGFKDEVKNKLKFDKRVNNQT